MTPASNPSQPVLRVLMVEDNPSDAHLLMHELKRGGREVRLDVVSTRDGLLAALRGGTCDVVLSDYNLVGWNGMEVLRILQEQSAPPPFILITGSLGDEKAAECIKLGAADFVLKDRLNRLPFAIERALQEKALRARQALADAALRESEERYRLVAETATDALITIDEESRILFVNPAAERIFGHALDEMLGQELTMLMPEYMRHVHRAGIRRYLDTGKKHLNWAATEVPGRHKSGKEIPLEVSFGELAREGGHTFTGIVRDISQRKQAEEALRRSEANLRSLVENAPYAIYQTSVDSGRFLSANPTLVRMLGYDSEAEVLALDLPTQVYRDPAARARLLPELERQEHFQNLELEWKRKDGKLLTLRSSGRMVQSRSGERFFEAIAEDVTERRSLEAQLQQAQKMEAVGRLAGGVAHDFNNLLTVIRGYAELILAEPDREKVACHAGNIINATDRTAALTRQLLAFSRKQVLWPRVLDLNSVLAESQKLLPPLIGEDIHVIVIPSPKLGRVKADPGQLEQVLLNLAINARDAMPKGGKLVLETADVVLDEDYCRLHRGARPGAYVMLAVSDNGSGMDAEIQSHIFEPFFTTKPKDKGTGLGLATVYGIVKQSGGHIWVYSEVGEGTTFKVYLPRVDEAADAPRSESRFEEPVGATETILLVEDEAAVRRLARGFLERRGYCVLEAPNGAEALQVAAAHAGPIHLLITDIVMPGMRGRELAERLCAERPQLRVLYISGYTDGTIQENGDLGKGSAFLEKPFSSESLARKVREVLNGSGSGARPADDHGTQPAGGRQRLHL